MVDSHRQSLLSEGQELMEINADPTSQIKILPPTISINMSSQRKKESGSVVESQSSIRNQSNAFKLVAKDQE